MKFLLITRPKVGPVPPVTAEMRDAARKFLAAALEDKRMDCIYSFIPSGGVSIMNAESHEALWASVAEYPLHALFDWKVEPLVDIDYVFEQLSKM